jgi:AAA+ superfamily predicted ATPase
VSTTIEAAVNALNAERLAPQWFDTIRQRFLRGESHMFLVHGNIFDFVYPGWPVENWVEGQFMGTSDAPRRDVVMKVGLNQITFATERMRRLFEATMGFELPSDPDERAALTQSDLWSEAHPGDFPLPSEPSAMLKLALDFLKKARRDNPDDPESGALVPGGARNAALIVSRADLLIPPADKGQMTPERLKILEMLEIASTDTDLEYAQNPIVLMSPSVSEVHPDVAKASGLRQVRVPLPDMAERLQFIRDLIELKPWMEMEIAPEHFAAITPGQNRRDIEDITLRAGDHPLTEKLALDRGQELMDVRFGSVLKRLNPTFGFEGIGGNDGLKSFLQRKVINRIRAGITEGVPMGMLLAGPPGTGKSALAIAAAKETRINAVEIKVLKEKWVGSSERNLEILIEGVEMFAPTYLFIDEYDKAFGESGGENEHPVDAAMQKRMQEWLADESHRGRIFLMAACNYPNRVPPAMMRTGRIDVKAAMLAPETEEERVDILHRLLIRYGHPEVDAVSLIEFGEPTHGWVGSDLEFAVSQAVGDCKEDETLSIIAALRLAIEDVIPADNAAIRQQEQEALRACNVNSLLPRRERERRQRERTEPRGVDPQGGRLRTARREDGPVL